MGRLRALRAYGGAVLTLALVVAVLTSATLVVAGVAAAGGGRSGIALPLLVLVVLAVPAPALELARRRRDQVTLARVRGVHGGSWVGAAAGQPATTALTGAALGAGVGVLVLEVLSGRWGTEAGLGDTDLRWAVTVAVSATVLAAGCGLLVSREPLVVALRRPRWQPRTGVAALAGGLALTVAAAAAGYLGTTGEGDPGPLVLAGAGLVAVVAGLAVAAGLRALIPPASASLAGRPVGVLVGLRSALASGATIRTAAVIASAVVSASALSGATAARDWAADAAAIRSGAPLRFELPDDHALGAVHLTERLDPDGRWLMAVAVDESATDEDSDPLRRVAWLDLSRYDAVMAGHLSGTPAELGDVASLRDATGVEVVTGEQLEMTVTPDETADTADPADPAGTEDPRVVDVSLRYLDDEGGVVAVTAGFDPIGRSATISLPVEGCAVSCVVLELTATGPVTVESLRLGGNDLLTSGWATADGQSLGVPLGLTADEAVVPLPSRAPVPMLVAGDPDWPESGPVVQAVGGDPRPVQEVAERDALPMVVGGGLVGDLRVGLAAASASVPALRVLVLARAGLPADLRSELVAAGADLVASSGGTEAELASGTLADSRSRLVVGIAAAVTGLLVLASGAASRLRSARGQRAALRLAGVATADLRRATRVETAAVAGVVGVVTGVGSWLAVVTTVDGTGLVPSGPNRLLLGTAATPGLLALAALAAALAVGLAGTAVAGRARRRSAPALLLEPGARRTA
ncbi:MAG TPA: hypothetical protein VD859_13125 [Nocardioides sp.]|nr:hypothetical protein [Nocardioides sp.]